MACRIFLDQHLPLAIAEALRGAGHDATQKGPLEGYQREWPPDIEMSPEIKQLVDRKWSEYGIG